MCFRAACWALALFTTLASAAPISSYDTARAAWEKAKDDPAVAAYLKEFIQFNNAMKLDSKDGCYSQPGGKVKLMLLITHNKGERWATVSQVFSQTDSPKAQCLQRSYRGVPTKVPPVLPYIVQLDFE